MPAYQFLNPAPVFFDLLAQAPADGGSLQFYDIGTTNPRDTWSDTALSVLNTNPVLLDSSGRSENPIFLDGSYTVVCKADDDTVVWTRDVIPGGDDALTIPDFTGKDGYALFNDGVNLVWQDINNRLLPDATDSTDQYAVTVDGGYTLRDIPTDPDIPAQDVVIDTVNKTITIGNGSSSTKFMRQSGTGSAPATSAKGTSEDITFGTEFSEVWFVDIMPNITAATPSGALVDWSITDLTNTGCTVSFNVSDDDNNSAWMISNPIDFRWRADGTVVVTD